MKTFHQPVALMSSGLRSEESSSPSVGTSQNRPTRSRKTRRTPPLTAPAIREPSDRRAVFASGADAVFMRLPAWAVIAAPPA